MQRSLSMRPGPFFLLCTLVGAARLVELRLSRAHERRLAHLGGQVVKERVFPVMAALHAGVLVAAPVEAWLRARPPARPVVVLCAALLVGATALRVWALRTLGDAWSVHVVGYPDGARPVVTRGPYRFVRHPNYAAVIVELAALPLLGGAWLTAVVGSALDGWVLSRRIPAEERALFRDARYRAALGPLPRFLPRPRRAPA